MTASSKDLEAIVTCLEVSALCLSTELGKKFSKEKLFAGAKEMMPFDDEDLEIVLKGMIGRNKTFKQTGSLLELI